MKQHSVFVNFKNIIFSKSDGHKKKPNVFLYFAAFIVNIMNFVCGIAFAWSSPVSPKLQSIEDNPLGVALSLDEISWLASLVALGCTIGPFLGGYLADKFGRKTILAATAIPTIATFIALALGNNLMLYYITRFILGLCVGLYLTVIPMYVGEIAEVHNRGTVGCFGGLLLAIGFLFGYGVGPYVSMFWFNIYSIIPSIIFLIIFVLFIPESPCYFIMKNRQEDAKQCLKKLRRGDVDNEFLDMTTMVKEFLENKKGILDLFKTKHLFKSLNIMVGLVLSQQLTAIGPVIYYIQPIFESANTSIPTEICSIIIGVVQVIGTFLSSMLVDRLGRRPLLLFSAISTAIALIILSIYFYLLDTMDVTSIGWLPLATLIFYIFCSNIGVRPLPFVILGEIFPPNIKPAASAIVVCSCFSANFIIVKIFPIMADLIGNWLLYLLFGIGNVLSVFFIWYYFPETKGKTLREIVDSFK